MTAFDLVVRNGQIVTESAVTTADLGVVDGQIAAVAPSLAGSTASEIDASGLHLMPGVIDAHVHLNEPGRTGWEGIDTGTTALAAGGATTCFDMPLNAHPPTIDAASFDLKQRAIAASAQVDIALWGGLVPGNLDRLDELAARGVIGFKAFMSRSGTDDFPAADDFTLHQGMYRAATLGLPVAVHAENDRLTAGLAAAAVAAGRNSPRDYLASRPVVAEIEAIERALLFGEDAGCAVHIVHVSTGRGVALVAAARRRGVDASCETCPHYLLFTEDDLERLGAVAKCAPPLRARTEQEALWTGLVAGTLPMVSSDHSPSPGSLKEGDDFFAIWGGIAGCQSLLPALLTGGYHARGMTLPTVARAIAGYAGRRFHLSQKGEIAVGFDADLAFVDLDAEYTLAAGDLHYRHRLSPFVGYRFRGRIVRTLLRGQTVMLDGKLVSRPTGRLIRPEPRTTASAPLPPA
ncbi:MAG: allantoinase AllB [Chloroflexota bacterium]|nr:allantoinase AllB [Chloroflexota bacterium]